MAFPEVNGVGNGDNTGYTPIKVKDKDSGKVYTINFVNAKIKGNEASWEIKDGKLYDKSGKSIDDLTMEVTRYQAALIRAAANGDGDDKTLDANDLNGAAYAEQANKYLRESQSEFKLVREVFNDDLAQYSEYYPSADAYEHGVIYAEVENRNNPDETGGITIDIRTPEQLEQEAKWKADQAKILEDANKPWWKFW